MCPCLQQKLTRFQADRGVCFSRAAICASVVAQDVAQVRASGAPLAATNPRQLMTLIRLRGQFLLQPQWRRIRVGGTVVRSLQHEECRDRGLIETARAYAPTNVRRHI
jgi:hypothetical protein